MAEHNTAHQSVVPTNYKYSCDYISKNKTCPYEHTYMWHQREGVECKNGPGCGRQVDACLLPNVQQHLSAFDHTKHDKTPSSKNKSRQVSPRMPFEDKPSAVVSWAEMANALDKVAEEPKKKTCKYKTNCRVFTGGRWYAGYWCDNPVTGARDICDECFSTPEGKEYLREHLRVNERKMVKRATPKATPKATKNKTPVVDN